MVERVRLPLSDRLSEVPLLLPLIEPPDLMWFGDGTEERPSERDEFCRDKLEELVSGNPPGIMSPEGRGGHGGMLSLS